MKLRLRSFSLLQLDIHLEASPTNSSGKPRRFSSLAFSLSWKAVSFTWDNFAEKACRTVTLPVRWKSLQTRNHGGPIYNLQLDINILHKPGISEILLWSVWLLFSFGCFSKKKKKTRKMWFGTFKNADICVLLLQVCSCGCWVRHWKFRFVIPFRKNENETYCCISFLKLCLERWKSSPATLCCRTQCKEHLCTYCCEIRTSLLPRVWNSCSSQNTLQCQCFEMPVGAQVCLAAENSPNAVLCTWQKGRRERWRHEGIWAGTVSD